MLYYIVLEFSMNSIWRVLTITEGHRATVCAPAVLFVPLIHHMQPERELVICCAAVYLILVGCRGCRRLFGAPLVLLCIEGFVV